MHNCYSNYAYKHDYCSSSIYYFNIIFIYYPKKNTLFFLSPLTWATPTPLNSLSLFHSWALPFIFSLRLLLDNSCSFLSPREIMWSVWGFFSPIRRVDQLGGISIDWLWANFSKKVWVFLIEILGFFGFKKDSWEFL